LSLQRLQTRYRRPKVKYSSVSVFHTLCSTLQRFSCSPLQRFSCSLLQRYCSVAFSCSPCSAIAALHSLAFSCSTLQRPAALHCLATPAADSLYKERDLNVAEDAHRKTNTGRRTPGDAHRERSNTEKDVGRSCRAHAANITSRVAWSNLRFASRAYRKVRRDKSLATRVRRRASESTLN